MVRNHEITKACITMAWNEQVLQRQHKRLNNSIAMTENARGDDGRGEVSETE